MSSAPIRPLKTLLERIAVRKARYAMLQAKGAPVGVLALEEEVLQALSTEYLGRLIRLPRLAGAA